MLTNDVIPASRTDKVHRLARSHRGLWTIVAILSIASVIRLALLAPVIASPERAITPDSNLYLQLGNHFIEAFVVNSPEFRWASLWRTPLYPAFCSLCSALPGPQVLVVLLGQLVLSVATVALTFGLGAWIGNFRVGLTSALLLAIDPLSVTYACYVRNEVLFVFLLLAACVCWYRALQSDSSIGSLAAGMVLGLSVLARPVATYLPVLMVPATLWLAGGGLARRAFHAILLVTAFALPVGGWLIRNHQQTGYWLVSSIEGTNLLYYRAAGAMAEETGRSRREIELEWKQEMATRMGGETNPAVINKREKAEGMRLLLAHPYGAVCSSFKGLCRLLFGPGLTATRDLLQPHAEGSSVLSNGLLVYQCGYLLIVLATAVVGTLGLYHRNRLGLAVLAVFLVYFLIICAAPEAYSRFRLPLMPLICILAASGFTRHVPRGF